jgi:Icc protein
MEDVLGPAAVDPVARRRVGGWDLAFLDCTVPGHEYGRIGPDRLAALEDIMGQERLPLALFLHQHPVPVRSAWLDRIGILDGAELISLRQRHPRLRVVAFGHVHQAFAARVHGCRLLGAPSTCVQFLPGRSHFAIDPIPPGYRSIELFRNGEVSTRVMRARDCLEPVMADASGY